jgi:hypothetical protein
VVPSTIPQEPETVNPVTLVTVVVPSVTVNEPPALDVPLLPLVPDEPETP